VFALTTVGRCQRAAQTGTSNVPRYAKLRNNVDEKKVRLGRWGASWYTQKGGIGRPSACRCHASTTCLPSIPPVATLHACLSFRWWFELCIRRPNALAGTITTGRLDGSSHSHLDYGDSPRLQVALMIRLKMPLQVPPQPLVNVRARVTIAYVRSVARTHPGKENPRS
jgi:hypothetical protein